MSHSLCAESGVLTYAAESSRRLPIARGVGAVSCCYGNARSFIFTLEIMIHTLALQILSRTKEVIN